MMARGRYNPRTIKAKPYYDIAGEKFHASTGEGQRWVELELLERAGEISELEHQTEVVLLPAEGRLKKISWRVDSSYIEKGRKVWEDYKPRPFSDRELLLVKLWRRFGPGLLRITTKKGKRFTVKKEIMGHGA